MSQENSEKRYKVLIVEDDPDYAIPLKLCLNNSLQFTTMAVIDSATEALHLVKAGLPDAIIVDLQLNEGSGITLMETIFDMKDELAISPCVIALTDVESLRTQKLLKKIADVSFLKQMKGYSPEVVLGALAAMIPVFDRNRPKPPPQIDTDLDKESRLRKRIERELDCYYIKHGNDAKDLLSETIYLVLQVPKYEKPVMKNILVAVGKKYDKDWRNVNVRIDYLLQKAFSETNEDDLERVFTPYLSVSRTAPTNKEFVMYTADKIRAEGFVD